MSKALNLGVLAWSPLAKGVLSGKYHGEGKADGGRMSNEGMKEFLPEEQLATRRGLGAAPLGKRTNQPGLTKQRNASSPTSSGHTHGKIVLRVKE
jgi:aryl-alcohol dehydrogenase-like predicted oxidoreductase